MPPQRDSWVRVAPDGTRLALGYDDPTAQIALWNIRNTTFTVLRLSSVSFPNGPVWTPSGDRLLFQARVPNGPANIWWVSADGSDAAERLTTTESNPQRPTGTSPDGSKVIFMEARPSLDVMELALDSSRTVRELIHMPGSFEAGGVISPDGRWLTYESDASGRLEVYVCSYPDVTKSSTPVTTGGAGAPRWLAKTGRELFFATLEGTLMRASVEYTGATVQFGTPTRVLDLTVLAGSTYGAQDIAPDGRIVVIKRTATPPEVNVVLNWNLELARLVPMK